MKKRNVTHHLSFMEVINFLRLKSKLLIDGSQFQVDSKG